MNAYVSICSAYVRRIEPVGSRITCNPPVLGTDVDYLVLIKSGWRFYSFSDQMVDAGWTVGGSQPESFDPDHTTSEDFTFYSFTRGNANVIATSSAEFFDRFMLATKVAAKLNLLNKADRITLFQAILYGNAP